MHNILSKSIMLGAGALALGTVWVGSQSSSPVGEFAQVAFIGEAHAAEKAMIIPAPRLDAKESGNRAVAIFAGGCFWGVEGVFEHTKGVITAASGYHGGSKASANYTMVSSGMTNHAEAVRVVYDPSQVSYGQLMQIYFSVVADPTMLNAQGPDHGPQYRSALIPTNAAQDKAARAYIAQLQQGKYWNRPIVTKVEAYKAFYPAESYHQNFIQNNPDQGYINRFDKPKIANLKRVFPNEYRSNPVS